MMHSLKPLGARSSVVRSSCVTDGLPQTLRTPRCSRSRCPTAAAPAARRGVSTSVQDFAGPGYSTAGSGYSSSDGPRSDYDCLRGATVLDVGNGGPVELISLWQAWPGTKVVVAFMTHFADLSSWEYVQKLKRVIPTLEASGVRVITVGLGSRLNAQEFARIHGFPLSKLYADETGACYRALGFSAGFRPEQLRDVSAYARLLPMLMGIGSPGTLQEVIRGYAGDRSSKAVWDTPTPFDILGSGYQRPFELATLRLFNMVGILPKWGELCPPDEELLTQQGGTVAFNGQGTTFRHADRGILDYCEVDELLRAVLLADEVIEATAMPVAPLTSDPPYPPRRF